MPVLQCPARARADQVNTNTSPGSSDLVLQGAVPGCVEDPARIVTATPPVWRPGTAVRTSPPSAGPSPPAAGGVERSPLTLRAAAVTVSVSS